MFEWLQKLLRRPAVTAVSLLLLFFGIPWVILGIVSVVSDVGFSSEITKYRWWIVGTAAALGVLAVVLYLYWFLYHQVMLLRLEVSTLRSQNQDLTEQKESAFRLMERYKTEAQEDIFKRLRELAISSILQPKWKKKGARVERFRVEGSVLGNEDLHVQDSLDRVTIFINLGSRDGVLTGMRFFVQDPTDFKKYGTIVVNACHEGGSSCSIVETDHPAFWVEIREALRSPSDSPIIQATQNIIVPTSPYKELDPENATQLLDWLIKLESVDL